MQEQDAAGINGIIDCIAEMTQFGLQPSKYITTTLIPPVVLILQMIEMTLSSVSNIANVFQTLNVKFDPYHFFKKYVPFIDWDELKKSGQEQELTNTIKTQLGGSQAAGGMGGGMGGGGGGYY